jgi:hypothetical protein
MEHTRTNDVKITVLYFISFLREHAEVLVLCPGPGWLCCTTIHGTRNLEAFHSVHLLKKIVFDTTKCTYIMKIHTLSVDVHESVHRDTIMKVTNKMQLYRLIYFNLVSTHPRHQPPATWLHTTRYCKYSQVLLMMGENIARNM